MVKVPASILVVDKPRGRTSHDVVARLRRVLGTRRIGHCGTLDPMATGVLVVAIEDGTKLVPWLTADDKSYEATITLGTTTDSLDADGVETARTDVPRATRDALATLNAQCMDAGVPAVLEGALEAALASERVRTSQMPPAVSAIRLNGERAHEIARRGEVPMLAPRSVAVRSLELVGGGIEPTPHLDVALSVGKGYFVRSLARDLAEALGTVGHLTRLRRTRSGAFNAADAISLDAEHDAIVAALVPIERAAARAMPVSVLSDDGVIAARHGKRIAPAELRDAHGQPSAWLDERGALVAIGELDADGLGRVLRGFS